MSARLDSIARGLNGQAAKVLEALPLAEAWTLQQVAAEMRRTNGTAPPLDVMQGCIQKLLEVGLARRDADGRVRKIGQRRTLHAIEVAAPLVLEVAPAPAATTPPEPPAPSEIIARLGALVDRIRMRLIELDTIADELEAEAVEVADELREAGESAAKLEQLRTLLRGLA